MEYCDRCGAVVESRGTTTWYGTITRDLCEACRVAVREFIDTKVPEQEPVKPRPWWMRWLAT